MTIIAGLWGYIHIWRSIWVRNHNLQLQPELYVPHINCYKCINTYQLVLPHWACLFWSGSPWQCQDSVSLVHCTAVTYSHSLTHIYSSSIIGLDARHTQTTAGPRKNGWKTKPRAPAGRLQLVLSGALWVIMRPPSPRRHPAIHVPREKMRTIRGGEKHTVTLFFFFFPLGVTDGDVLKTLTAALSCFEGTQTHHIIMELAESRGGEHPSL